MPSTLRKNLNFCFPKIKRPLYLESSDTSPTAADYSHQLPSTTASILLRNINSQYGHTFDSAAKSLTFSPSSLPSEPDMDTEFEPDFATVLSSQRFFFTSPGTSNSITESAPSIATAVSSDPGATDDDKSPQSCNTPTVKEIVVVPTFSPDPFTDFLQSMHEMVQARGLVDVKANWDNLHELLLCYLALNPKSTHKFIVGAFADLLGSLMVDCGSSRKTELSDGGRSIPEQCTCNLV